MTKLKWPKYIEELLPRLRLATVDEAHGEYHGYYWKLKGKYPYGKNQKLGNDAEKLVKWAIRNHAHAELIEYTGQNKRGYWDAVTLVITDPIAIELERAKGLRNPKISENTNEYTTIQPRR